MKFYNAKNSYLHDGSFLLKFIEIRYIIHALEEFFTRKKGDLKMKRKNFGKKVIAVLCVFMLMLAFVSCGGGTDAPADDNTTTKDPAEKISEENQLCTQKYKEAMKNLLTAKVFPNGDKAYTDEGDDTYGWGENDFAITDIDGDSIDELLIQVGNAPTVGEVFYIFQYDAAADSFRTELAEFPAVDFFEGGWLTVQAAQNQGMGGDFWPYAIYKYNAEKDVYEQQYYIDAWDKEYFPEDYQGNPYPSKVDTSKTGIVYYIYKDINKAVDPVDKTEYDKLVADTYGNSTENMVDYKKITEENIEAIGE